MRRSVASVAFSTRSAGSLLMHSGGKMSESASSSFSRKAASAS